ncbi:MAG: type II/IV secretion system ATPase subunit [Candidatus Hydrothermarchaeales archaeon]
MGQDSDAFRSAMDKNPHLRKYVDDFVVKKGDKPRFYLTLTRDLERLEFPNIIYSVGDPIYIHIYREKGELMRYLAVTPKLDKEDRRLYEEIFNSLVLAGLTTDEDPENAEDLKIMLNRLLNEITVIGHSKRGLRSFIADFSPIKKVYLDSMQYERIRYHLITDLMGVGVLEPFFRDSWIEDISCNGLGNLFIIHRIFKTLETNIRFTSDRELDEIAYRLSEMTGTPISDSNPICDGALHDNSRVNILYSRDISKKGSSFSIRRFSAEAISIVQIAAWGTISAQMAAYLWMCVEYGMSLFICGESACGKTTTLNAITAFIPEANKIFTVEDTPEVSVAHANWQRLLTRQTKKGEESGDSVTMFDLLKAALRSRPNYIIPGEIRGAEASVAFQGIQTGHPVMATFHAHSVKAMLQRLTGKPINIPLPSIDNLNIVVIQENITHGKVTLRRITEIAEIETYSSEAGGILTRTIFDWDSLEDSFIYKGLFNSYILEKKLAYLMGYEDIREIYAELDLRAKIIKKMIRREMFDFFETFEIFSRYHEFGIKGIPFAVQ